MKRISLIILAVCALVAPLQAQSTITITDTLTKNNGQVWPYAVVKVTKVIKNGQIISNSTETHTADASGYISFTTYRRSTAFIYSRAEYFDRNGLQGVPMQIPDAATASLGDLMPASNIEVGITSILDEGTVEGLSITRLNFVGSGVVAEKQSDSVTVKITITAGAGSDTTSLSWRLEVVTDSLRKAYDSLGVHRTYMETVLAAISTIVSDSLELMVRTEADPVWLAEKSGYQTSLSAAQLARIDSGLAAGDMVTITDAGTIQVLSVDTTGFFAAFAGVMTESDPTATAKAQVVANDTINKTVPRILGQGGGGTLGQVLKVGPEGSRVWADDTTGGAGGSVIVADSLVNAPYGASFAGNLKYPMRIVDTTSQVVGDTASYVWTDHMPAMYARIKSNPYGESHVKIGSCDFTMVIGKNPNSEGPFQFNVVSDTANAVQLMSITLEMTTTRAQNKYSGYRRDLVSVEGSGSLWSASALEDNGAFTIGFDGVVVHPLGSLGNVELLYPVAGAGIGFAHIVRVRVVYLVTNLAASSTQPVKIINM